MVGMGHEGRGYGIAMASPKVISRKKKEEAYQR
jgi:hypothetical protein